MVRVLLAQIGGEDPAAVILPTELVQAGVDVRGAGREWAAGVGSPWAQGPAARTTCSAGRPRSVPSRVAGAVRTPCPADGQD